MDGALVNLGKHSGVGKRKQDEVPHLLITHAVAHNLELATHDSFDDCEYVQLTMKMNQDLYTWYHASAKKLGSKERKAKELDEKSFQIAGMHGIRWQEAGNRATVSVLKQWKTICSDLYQHAQELAGVQLNLESDPSVFIGLPVFYDFEVEGEGGRTRRYKGRVTEHLGCNTQGQEEFTLHFRYKGGEEMKTTQAELLGAFLREDQDKGSGTMKGFSSTPPGASLDHSAL